MAQGRGSNDEGTFTMAIIGHPFYAAGLAQPVRNRSWEVHDLLKSNGVPVMMAGDTHDFEDHRISQLIPTSCITSSTAVAACTSVL